MELFSFDQDAEKNLLPYGGTVNYYGRIFSLDEADRYLSQLLSEVEWKNDEAIVFGKKIVTKRKVAWYGDLSYEYAYSNVTKKALPWLPVLVELKSLAEQFSGETFNSCLLNLYHNGDEGMAYHSDAERDLKKDGAIGSMSFGAERKFLFKHKETKETIGLKLAHGSLLVMKDETQTNWLHRLPPTKLVNMPRVNLTFRTIEK
jgi:alkylated DNA repair dioxygenase AlkB